MCIFAKMASSGTLRLSTHCENFQLCKQSVCTLTHSMFPHYTFQPPLLCRVLFSSLWLRVDYTSTYDILDPKFLAFNNSSTRILLSIGGSASLSIVAQTINLLHLSGHLCFFSCCTATFSYIFI